MGLEINKVKYKSDWPLVRLKEISNRISDGTHFTPAYVKDGIPFISVKDIYNDAVHFDNCKYITSEAHKELVKRCHPEKDDILITKSGTIGRMALVPDKPEFSLFVSVALIKNKKEIINSKFLKFCLENFINSINIAQDIKGGLLKNFHLEDIRETLIPAISLSTQQAIASKIEELFSELDKGIEYLLTAQQQLKTYRQSVLNWAFEGRLTNDDELDSKTPKRWKRVQIKDISVMNPKLPDRENISPQFEVQFLPMKLVEEIINKIHLTETRKYQDVLKGSYTPFIDGDVIFAKVTPCMENGKIAIVTKLKNGIGFGSSEFHVIRPNSVLTKEYLFYYLIQDRFRHEAANEMTGAVGLRRVPKQFIENYYIPLPEVSTQKRTVQEIESRLSVADKMEESITQSLQQAVALRQSILKKAFEGKLVTE